jgi:hypothetical protein
MIAWIRNWLQRFEPAKDPRTFNILLAAIERLRSNAYIDRDWIVSYINSHLDAAVATWSMRRRVKLLVHMANKTQSAAADVAEVKTLRFRKHQAAALQTTFLNTGLGAYGLPMTELVKDDLLSPFMYQMALGTFRLSDKAYQNLQTLEGCYKLYLREFGSKFGEKRLLCVLLERQSGGRAPNSRGKIDARGIALEVARDTRDETLFVRRGSFIPFDHFCVSPLAWSDMIETDFLNYFSSVSPDLLDTLSSAKDEYLNILTIKDIGGREISGTYQYREKIGRFFGVRVEDGFVDTDISSLGILSETEIANLSAEEQRRFEQIKFARHYGDVPSIVPTTTSDRAPLRMAKRN